MKHMHSYTHKSQTHACFKTIAWKKKKAPWNKAVQFITPLHRTLKENSTGKQVLYLLNQLSRGEERYRYVYRGTWSPVLQSDIQGGLSGGPKSEANGKKMVGKQFS